jgi:hypothetical protein
MARNNARVSIPSNPTEQIALLGKVSPKHADLRDSSPLGSLKWPEIGTSLNDAKTHDDDAAGLAKQAEREYRARDAAMPKITQALRDARDLLLVANRDTRKRSAISATTSTTRPKPKPKPNPRPNPARRLAQSCAPPGEPAALTHSYDVQSTVCVGTAVFSRTTSATTEGIKRRRLASTSIAARMWSSHS